jgi:hypothetical protein
MFSPASPTAQKAKLYFIDFSLPVCLNMVCRWVNYLLSNVRNSLDVAKRDGLRLSLTTLQPDIQKIASVHLTQGTHRI